MNPTFVSYLSIFLSSIAKNGYPECPNITDYKSVGTVVASEIDEGSGLVWSQTDKDGMFWTINDSGGAAAAYAVNKDGEYVGKVVMDGAENIDFEAISTARCSDEMDSPYCLFIGDIGDNFQAYKNRIVYKVQEPTREELQANNEIITKDWSRVYYRYPKNLENSEAFIIDPMTREVVIITKGFFGARIYSGALDSPDGSSILLEDQGVELPMLLTTDASYSEGYYSIGVRTYNFIYLYKNDFMLRPFKTILAEDTPCQISLLPTGQVMGESLALDLVKKVYIHSEYKGKDIYLYDTIFTE